MATQVPSPKGAQPPPIFGPCLLWPNGCMDQDATWYGGRPWPKPHCATWGPSTPSPKRGHSPQFSAHVCCGQTDGRIKNFFNFQKFKMPLGMKVSVSPGPIVLHGDPAPLSQKGHSTPFFGSYLLWANGCPSQLLLSTCSTTWHIVQYLL